MLHSELMLQVTLLLQHTKRFGQDVFRLPGGLGVFHGTDGATFHLVASGVAAACAGLVEDQLTDGASNGNAHRLVGGIGQSYSPVGYESGIAPAHIHVQTKTVETAARLDLTRIALKASGNLHGGEDD